MNLERCPILDELDFGIFGGSIYVTDWNRLRLTEKDLYLSKEALKTDIVLVKPYYQSVISGFQENHDDNFWCDAYGLLTVLDLCHFPLRGIEQASSLFQRLESLKSICPWSVIENAVG